MRPSIYWPLALAATLFGLGCPEPTALYCDVDDDCVDSAPRTECSAPQHVCVVPGFSSPDLLPGPDGPPPPDLLPGPDLTEASGCVQTSDCVNDDSPVCGASGQCEPCDSALDDAICALRDATTPRCRLGVGTCVACRETVGNTQSDDCAGATTPVCTPEGACRSCRAHAECDAGICDLGEGGMQGRCVPESEIIHVDNRDLVVATCKTSFNTMQSGTAAEPYCDIDQAIDAVATRSVLWLKVAPHTALYGPLDLTSVTHGTVVVHGPGSTVTPRVTIHGGLGPFVKVSTAGLKLFLEGLVIGDAAATHDCLYSSGAQAIALKDVLLTNCDATGIDVTSSGGVVNAERLRVPSCNGIGIQIASADARITDSEVTSCEGAAIRILGTGSILDRVLVQGNNGGGIEVGPVSAAVIQNSSILGNGDDNTVSGPSEYGGVWARGSLHIINSTLESNEAEVSFAPQLRCTDGNAVAFNSVLLNKNGVATAPATAVCVLHSSAFAFAGAPINSNVTLTGCTDSDVFVRATAPIDLHPRKDAKDGCKLIDLGLQTAAGLTAPTVDFAGVMRPQGAGYDIGAFESTP